MLYTVLLTGVLLAVNGQKGSGGLLPSTQNGEYCTSVPFSAVVNSTNNPGCDFKSIDWDSMNVTEIIIKMKSFSNDCIDELKNNFNKLNATCLANMTEAADDLKTITQQNLKQFAEMRQMEWESTGCICPPSKDNLNPYSGNWGSWNGGCSNIPFSAVVNKTNKPTCNFKSVDWDSLNVSGVIVKMKNYSDDCIDEIKNNLHNLNSTCLPNMTKAAEDLKNVQPQDLQKFAEFHQMEWETNGCICPPDNYYNTYYGNYWNQWNPYGYPNYWGGGCKDVPFSAVVNKTNKPLCNFQSVDWDSFNATEIIKKMKNFSNDCIDELKNHFDQLNSSCLANFTKAAEDLKNVQPQDLQQFAERHHREWESKGCICSSYNNYYDYYRNYWNQWNPYGYPNYWGGGCKDVPFSAVVNKTNKPLCNFQSMDWDSFNATEIIKKMKNFSNDCIDELKNHFDQLNSSCLANFTKAAEDLKNVQPQDLQKFAERHHREWESKGCICSSYNDYYDYYRNYWNQWNPYGYPNYLGGGCKDVPFSAVVNKTNKPLCNFQSMDWDSFNATEIIKKMKNFSNDCIDELKNHFDQLNSSCLANFTKAAEDLKNVHPQDLQQFAERHHREWESKGCICSSYNNYYDYYRNYWNQWNPYGYPNYWGGGCKDVPFSAVVNKTNKPLCNFQSMDWDSFNATEIIKKMKNFSNDCIDELKNHFDQLNSSCLANFTKAAEDLKNVQPQELQQFAERHHREWESKGCICSSYNNYYDYYGNYWNQWNPYGYPNYWGGGCKDVPFSAVVNKTNKPLCNFQSVDWDSFNATEIIKKMKNFSNDCIDELKNHFDQLNSSCLANFTKAAEDLKNVQPQDLQQFAERHHREWESKGCICSSYNNYYDYYGNYWNQWNPYGYPNYWGGGCKDVPFSAVVNKTNKPLCNFQSVDWDSFNATEIIKKMKNFSNDCIDELKNHFDQLNSSCLANFTKAAEDLKNVQPQDLQQFAERHHREWESKGCICSSYNNYYNYYRNYWNQWNPYGYPNYLGGGCKDVPFSAVVNKTNKPLCNFQSVDWDSFNATEIIKKMKNFSNDCIDELKNHFDQLNSSCLANFTKAAEDLKNVQPQDLQQFAERHHREWESKGCICSSYNNYYNYYRNYWNQWNPYGYPNYLGGGCKDVPFSAVVNKTNKPLCNFQSVDWDSFNATEIIKKMKNFSNDCIDELKNHFDQLNSSCLANFTKAAEDLKNVQPQDLQQFAERHHREWESKGCICSSYNNYYNYYRNYWNQWNPYGYPNYLGGGCKDVPFSAVVNKTNKPLCNFQSVDWDSFNATEIIKKMKNFSNDCIDELKNHFDQLNSSCLANFTKAAEDLKNVQPQDLQQFAERHHREWESKGCICSSYNNYYNYYRNYWNQWNPYGYPNYLGGGCKDVPFSAVVNKTNKPLCNFQSVDWDSFNATEIIKKMKNFSNDCIDELKNHFDQLNSSCLANFTKAAEDLKNVQPQDLQQFAERHHREWESKGCICSSYNNYYNYYRNYWNQWNPYGYPNYLGGGCKDVPFSAVVNKTNKPLCNFQSMDWDSFNATEIIKKMKNFSNDCIDELKNHFDQLNSSCLANFTKAAEDLKNVQPQDLQQFAERHHREWESKGCICSSYSNYYDYYGNYWNSENKTDYWRGGCTDVPFSAVVKKTNKATGCNFHSVNWDSMNVTEVIMKMKDFSNDCIDELKNNFDQLNSTCLRNFTKAAEDLKNVQPQDLKKFAENHHMEWESEGCICPSHNYGYNGNNWNYWDPKNNTAYWRGGCTDVPFSAVVNKTNIATGCNFHSVNWDLMNVTEVIMKMKDFSNDCIDELKNNFDQLNSTCLRNFTKAAEDLKNVQPQDLKKFAENHHMEWESEGCICPSHNYGYNGNNWNYWDPKNNTAYWRGGCTDVPFSAVVNKTNIATGCNFHSVNWDLMNVTEVIMKMKDFSNDCIDELKNNFDQLNSTCLRNFTKAAEDLKNVQPQDLKQFAENHHMEWELKGCICPSNDYGNNDKDGSHWNLINNTNYWRGGCTDVPFSAVVNKTNKPVCNFQSVHWDSMNVSDIIIKMKDFSNDCIDELKKHFDQLNSTCLRNFTMAAENLKNVQAQDLKQFAERHQIEWESKGCICPSQNHSGNYDHNRYDISSTRPLRTSTEFITTPTRCIPSAVQCSYAAQCPGCAGSASTCWVFDSQMQKCAVPGWESDHERAWQHFASRWASLGNRIAIKPYAATCDNFKALMKGYLTLQDSIKNSFNDYVLTENIPSDFDQIPVELFATINDTLLPRFINNLTDIQKLQMALKIESANATYYCSLRQILPGLNFETLYERLVDANVINPFNNDFLSGRTCEYYLSGTCSEIISNPVDLLRYAPNCLQKRSRCLSLSSIVLSNVQAIEADLSMACRNPYYSGFDLSYVSSLYMASVSTLTCTQNLLELVLYCDLETRILEPCSYAELSAVKDFTNSTAFDKLLASKLPADRSTLTSTQISEVLRGFTFSELELLNPDELKTAVCTGNVIDDLEKVEKEFIYEKLTSASVLNAGTDADCIDILDTGSIAKTKTSSELNQDFTSGKYADKEFDSDVAFAIAEKVQSSVTTISDLVTRKAVAKAFSSQTIKSATGTLTQTEIKSLSETFADITVCKAKKVTFIEKALTSSGGLASLVKTDISEEIPLSSFESATISDLDFLSETSTEVVTANLTVTQASSCWDKVVSASIQMNYAYVSRMKSIAGAMTKSQMDSVSTTSSLEMYRTMTVISESKTINGEKLSHIAQRVKSQVISDGAGSVDVFELSANVLIGMDTTTLSSFNNLEDVVSQMKSADIYKWGRRKLKDSGILTFIKSALGIESGTIDFISASKMGNLLQLLDPADFDRFNADAIKYAAERLKDVYLCSSMRTKLATVYSSVALSSSTFASTEELSDLGALAIDLDDAIFSTASTTMLKDGLKTIRESIDIRMVSRAMFESNGYKMECSEENDETLFETKMKTKFSSFITALTTTSVAGRRRRSTSSLTCSQMQLLGSSGLTAMTTTQISAMTDVDFTSCASLLGGVTGFSSDQLTALADVAKRATVWGDPSTWSTSSIQQAGVIAQALSTSEIQSMTWTIDDVSRMGDFSGWDETKKVTIISQWLSTQKSNNAGSITSSEMQSLGHMTCGLSTAQIQAITVYSAAADKIGEVTSCTELQMVEFANLAKTTYGSSVTSWSGTQIAAVGVHIGGLSKTELSSLVETQIDAILETHVSYIPATAFSGFTTAQISTFSTAQAQSTTSTQRDALTSAQLTALETAAGISFSSTVVAGDSDNSAGGVSITILPLITCLVAILFNHAGRQM